MNDRAPEESGLHIIIPSSLEDHKIGVDGSQLFVILSMASSGIERASV